MSKPIRVLELGEGVAAAYAAKLLGDHGAEVIKVEPLSGDSLRLAGVMSNGGASDSGLFQAINVNKRGVSMAISQASIEPLIRWADIVVHNLHPQAAVLLGLNAESISKTFPKLIVLSITPFGTTGPYANYQATELINSNAGGWAKLCPATSIDPSLPPLKVYGDQCALMTGIAGAMTSLSCLLERDQSGHGEHIDLSIQAYVASVLEAGIPAYGYLNNTASRFHLRSLIPWRIFQAIDSPVFLTCIEQDQWERLVDFMGNPDWASLEVFIDQPARAENQDMVHTFVQEFVAEWHAMDLYHEAQKQRICVAPVMSIEQLSQDQHVRERDFFVTVNGSIHLAPAVLADNGREQIRMPSPSLGEGNGLLANLEPATSASLVTPPSKPLNGVRVLDMTWAWAGPFCSLNLAHLGAEVIRIESELRPDLYRRLPLFPEEMEPGINRSGMFNQWNQGKSSLSIDLSKPEAIEIVKSLVSQSDVVVQNFATGVMDRLGLGYEILKTINPGIILASISGYGQSGPYREYMGYGPAIAPLTGLSNATGYLNGPAEEIGLSMPDPTAGITAAWGIVSALEKRRQSGRGNHLDVSLWEATCVLNAEGWMQYIQNGTEPQRLGNRSLAMAPHGVFRCCDDLDQPGSEDVEDPWIAISCREDKEWQLIAKLIDDSLANDPRFLSLRYRKDNEDALEKIISEWTLGQNRWTLTRQLQSLGIPAFPSMSTRDIVEDVHLGAQGFIEKLKHPEVGVRPHAGIPWRFSKRENGVRSPAPCMGADTDRHLSELLGLDDAQIESLKRQNIVA
jgi:crotonobetainyl-CoA:carnitine CoA-transferase CaiB-like acyl-CoA transferase